MWKPRLCRACCSESIPLRPCVEVAMENAVRFSVTFGCPSLLGQMKLESAQTFHDYFSCQFSPDTIGSEQFLSCSKIQNEMSEHLYAM